mgnify:CR=1 FL=1
MKKYLVIGNPIEHSLSPKLHNYWIKTNHIDAIYEKKRINENEIESLIYKIKEKNINGINVTVPFKKSVIPFLDKLSLEAEKTQSVNTISLKNDKIIGHNTDIDGFELSMKNTEFNFNNKKILILGAGGVVPSIIFTLKKMKISNITICNRTKSKAEILKELFHDLTIVEWGENIKFDMIINATSVGLNKNDEINLNFLHDEKGKFFYDVIYNPKETNFLKKAKKDGNLTKNGKEMFIYQAAAAFKIWHGIQPKISENIFKIIDL